MSLSDSLRAALENLHQKQSGVTVDWINIADARELTELGLAKRSHQGWAITEAGQEARRAQPDASGGAEHAGKVVDYP